MKVQPEEGLSLFAFSGILDGELEDPGDPHRALTPASCAMDCPKAKPEDGSATATA